MEQYGGRIIGFIEIVASCLSMGQGTLIRRKIIFLFFMLILRFSEAYYITSHHITYLLKKSGTLRNLSTENSCTLKN